MEKYLNKIRKPKYISISKKIIDSLLIFALGIMLGIISKALDETASNLLPLFIEQLDLGNFFSRIGIWMFIGICVSIYSKTPLRGGINTLLFFTGMVSSYYIYTIAVAGFFPKSYMVVWIVFTALSPFLGAVCWYAKGTHVVSIFLSSLIFAMMMRQAINFGFWYFDISYYLELFLWIATAFVLYQKPKQIAAVIALGVVLFFMTSQLYLFGGML